MTKTDIFPDNFPRNIKTSSQLKRTKNTIRVHLRLIQINYKQFTPLSEAGEWEIDDIKKERASLKRISAEYVGRYETLEKMHICPCCSHCWKDD